MRPRGEVRDLVVRAVQERPATLREIVQRCCLGYDAARRAVDNAVRCGDILRVGERREPHSRRPVAVYGR